MPALWSAARWRETFAWLEPHNSTTSETDFSPLHTAYIMRRREGSERTLKYSATCTKTFSIAFGERSLVAFLTFILLFTDSSNICVYVHILDTEAMGSYIVGYPSPQWQYNQKMDIDAILLSLKLAFWTMALILPFGVWVAHKLIKLNRSRPWIEAALALPLVLPPTVLGYYFLVSFGNKSIFGIPLVFSFTGILLASLIVNIPFAIQPIQRAFEAINPEIREAAQVSGLSNWQIFRLIELPLSWRGITGAAALTFAHTLGEFGVVLMVGGAIPGETKTASIAIYDKVQSFDTAGAGAIALVLLGTSLICIALSYGIFGGNPNRRRGLT